MNTKIACTMTRSLQIEGQRLDCLENLSGYQSDVGAANYEYRMASFSSKLLFSKDFGQNMGLSS